MPTPPPLRLAFSRSCTSSQKLSTVRKLRPAKCGLSRENSSQLPPLALKVIRLQMQDARAARILEILIDSVLVTMTPDTDSTKG